MLTSLLISKRLKSFILLINHRHNELVEVDDRSWHHLSGYSTVHIPLISRSLELGALITLRHIFYHPRYFWNQSPTSNNNMHCARIKYKSVNINETYFLQLLSKYLLAFRMIWAILSCSFVLLFGKLSKYCAYDELVFDKWIRDFDILSSILWIKITFLNISLDLFKRMALRF